MLADRVVEHLDVIEHVLPGFFARFLGASPDALTLEEIEEALGDGVIVAVYPPAHGVFQIMSPGEGRPFDTGNWADSTDRRNASNMEAGDGCQKATI